MDITAFAGRAKQRGYVEAAEAELLKELAGVWLEWQELHADIAGSPTPVAGTKDKAKMEELRTKMQQLEDNLNA